MEVQFDDDLQLKGCAFVVVVEVVKMKSKKIGKVSRVWFMVILFCLLCVFCVCFFLDPCLAKNNEVRVL